MAYELLSLTRPFNGNNLHSLVLKICTADYAPLPPHCSAACTNLVDLLLNKNPKRRPRAADLLTNPIFQRNRPIRNTQPPDPAHGARLTGRFTAELPLTPSRATPPALPSQRVSPGTPGNMTPSEYRKMIAQDIKQLKNNNNTKNHTLATSRTPTAAGVRARAERALSAASRIKNAAEMGTVPADTRSYESYESIPAPAPVASNSIEHQVKHQEPLSPAQRISRHRQSLEAAGSIHQHLSLIHI